MGSSTPAPSAAPPRTQLRTRQILRTERRMGKKRSTASAGGSKGRSISKRDYKILRQVFIEYDKDSSGTVTYQEFLRVSNLSSRPHTLLFSTVLAGSRRRRCLQSRPQEERCWDVRSDGWRPRRRGKMCHAARFSSAD